MNSEERFKKQLNDLLESKDFPFDEGNWENARKLIDKSSGNRRGYIPFAITALFLLLSGVFGFYYLSPADALVETKTTQQTKEQAPMSVLAPESKPASPITSERPLNTNAGKNNSELTSLPTQKPQLASTSDKISPAKVSNIQPDPEKTQANEPSEPVMNTTTKTNPPINTTDILMPINAALVDNNTVSMTAAPVSAETKTSKAPEEPAITKNSGPASNSAENDSASNTTESHNDLVINSPAATPEAALQVISAPAPSDHAPYLSNEVLLPATASLSTASAVKSEQPDTATSANHFDDANFPQKSRFPLLTVEAGASYLFGWKNPTGTDAQGFNPLVGLSYYTYLRPKVSVLIGAQYASVGNLNYSSVTTKITSFGMGEESQVTVITPQRLHYLIIPVKLNYHLNAKNTFGIGCNIAYLLTVDAKIESYEQGLNYTRDYNLGKTSGYTQGFKTFDTQLSVSYRRMIYKNLSVSTEGFFGLTDNKENNFFGLNVFERNKGFKLTLVYNLKNK